MAIDFCLKCGTPFRGEAGCPLCGREMPGSAQDHEDRCAPGYCRRQPACPVGECKAAEGSARDHEAGIEAAWAAWLDERRFGGQRESLTRAIAAYLRAFGPVDPATPKKLIVDWTEDGQGIVLDPSTDPMRVVGTHGLEDARISEIRTEMVARIAQAVRYYAAGHVRTMSEGEEQACGDIADFIEREFPAPVQADTEETSG